MRAERLVQWADALIVLCLAAASFHSDDPAQRAAYTVGLVVISRLAMR